MASILTNGGAMAALQTLRSIESGLSTSQDRISSGLKVGSASDNAAYWSISTTMKSESSSLNVVGEALGMGASLSDVASTAVQSLTELMSQVRDRVVAAGESTNDQTKIQTELAQIYTQMTKTVEAATFNNVNWLTGMDGTTAIAAETAKVLSGVTGGKLDTISVDLKAGGALTSAVVKTVTDLTGADIEDLTKVDATLAVVDKAIASLTTLGSTFGAATTRIDTQKGFISSLTDAIDRGVGSLVDADMNEESTRLKAMQTQQQLAVQSLSIANSSTDSILSLFR